MNSGELTAVVNSFAKVNLTLDVLGVRPDGYHEIESVMQSIGLHDTITLRTSEEQGIRVTCSVPSIPTDERNLAVKAATALFSDRGMSAGLDIHIEKRIPAEAGLGGGSSNAAAVLNGLIGLCGIDISACRLYDLAAQIGSDVPFFLVGGTALVRGRGEEIQPLPDIPTWWMVIVKPPFGVSTPWAYKRLDEMRPDAGKQCTASMRIRECIDSMDCTDLPDLLSNDLELPAVERHPVIAEIESMLANLGAKGTLMCGSGSAVFGLFGTGDEAHRAAGMIPAEAGTVFMTRTMTRDEAVGTAV